MTKINRRLTLLGLGSGLLSACSEMQIADGDKPEPRGGLGGTGIVGVITDFGSLMVNGLRVETPTDLFVTTALGPIGVGELAIGQSLTIEAVTEAGVLSARRVHLTHPVIGEVQEVSPDGRVARIAGIQVLREPGAVGEFKGRVAVSGLWRGDQVLASRIDPMPAGAEEVIAGEIREAKGGVTIGGQTLELGTAPKPLIGGFATVIGQATPQGFEVSKLTEGRFTGAAGPLKDLSIEGYLEPVPSAPFFAVSGLGHSFDQRAALTPLASNRAVFSGAYIGTFQVETALRLPEDQTQRRALLRQAAQAPDSLPLVPTRA